MPDGRRDQLAPGLTLIIGFEENADAVRWQCASSRQDAAARRSAADSLALYERLREATGGPLPTHFKATMLSSQGGGFVQRSDRRPSADRAGRAALCTGCSIAVAPHPPGKSCIERPAAKGDLHLRGPLARPVPASAPREATRRFSRGGPEGIRPGAVCAGHGLTPS